MKLSANWRKKLEEICDTVTNRQEGKLETTGPITKMALSPYLAMEYRIGLARYRRLSGRKDGSYKELVPMTDMGFRYNEKCNGCGICANICPTDNIKLVDKKPVWQHHCESCYACFQWCPREAIGGDTPRYEKKYHHPAVNLKDMLIRK
jgi:ferredoxin